MSDFLGGILKPGEAARVAMLKFVMAKMVPRFDGNYAHDAATILVEHGHYFAGRELPDQYAHLRGPMQRCFGNSLLACIADANLTYHEGLYTVGDGTPAVHGFAVEPSGQMLELTFPTDVSAGAGWVRGMGEWMPPEHYAYYGVPFETDYVEWHDSEGGLGIFYCSNPDHDHRDGIKAT